MNTVFLPEKSKVMRNRKPSTEISRMELLRRSSFTTDLNKKVIPHPLAVASLDYIKVIDHDDFSKICNCKIVGFQIMFQK